MTELDEFVPELAVEVLDEFGGDYLYHFTTPGTRNDNTGRWQGGTDVTRMVKAYIEEYSPRELVAGVGYSKSGVLAGDKKVYLAAQGLYAAPTPEDAIEVDGDKLTVMEVNAHRSGQLVALYVLNVRRA